MTPVGADAIGICRAVLRIRIEGGGADAPIRQGSSLHVSGIAIGVQSVRVNQQDWFRALRHAPVLGVGGQRARECRL
jgi:hypothetical protein